MHRYQYSLDLLSQIIDKAPRFFSPGRKQEMVAALEKFKQDADAPQKEIDDAIIAFGKEIWPYRKAFWHIHNTDGRHNEQEYLLKELSPELLQKYNLFLKKGFQIQDIRHGGDFEDFFTSEEKHALIEAKLNAHNKVVDAIESLCSGEHKDRCEDALVKYKNEVVAIENLIEHLRSFAGRSDKWRTEILDKVRTFEEGWSGLEKEVTSEAVQGEIDYYSGIIELFE